MGKIWFSVRFLLVAVAVATYLPACGSSSSSPATSTAKSAYWTKVSVRSLDGKININWDKAADSTFGGTASTYNLYCADNPAMANSVRIATQYAGTSFDHTDVTNGLRYYYSVTEVSDAGEGPASRVVSASPQIALPATPFGLKVTALDAAVKLDFLVPVLPATSSVSFNLYRSTTRTGLSAAGKIASTLPYNAAGVSHSDTDLVNDTTYFYALKSVSNGKESEFSPIVSARPQKLRAAIDYNLPNTLASFGSPANMSAEPGNSLTVIKWTAVTPPAIFDQAPSVSPVPYYVLYWSDSPDVLNNVKGQRDDVTRVLTKDANNVFTYTFTGLTNGVQHYFQVTAAVTTTSGTPIPGRITAGPVVSTTPFLKTPAIPAGVSATQGPQQVLLSWNKDNSGISGVTYNIYVSTTDANSPAELMAKGVRKNNDDSSKTWYTHSGLQSGQTYYYVVTAVGEAESAPSSIIAVTL
jgi:fibronectin type 3 domain-containing protein